MVVSSGFIFFLFQATLFCLFLIKAVGLVKAYLVPQLKAAQQESHERMFTLQEKHAILIAKKKQLATQFLQQEKQIALLTAKLEAWYVAWKDTQHKKQQAFDAQARKSMERYAEQDKRVQERRIAGQASKQILANAEKTLQNDLSALHKSFCDHATEKLSPIQKEQV